MRIKFDLSFVAQVMSQTGYSNAETCSERQDSKIEVLFDRVNDFNSRRMAHVQ